MSPHYSCTKRSHDSRTVFPHTRQYLEWKRNIFFLFTSAASIASLIHCQKWCVHIIKKPFNGSRIDCLVDQIGIESVIISNCSQSRKSCMICFILCTCSKKNRGACCNRIRDVMRGKYICSKFHREWVILTRVLPGKHCVGRQLCYSQQHSHFFN